MARGFEMAKWDADPRTERPVLQPHLIGEGTGYLRTMAPPPTPKLPGGDSARRRLPVLKKKLGLLKDGGVIKSNNKVKR